jgi:hypothetical protein
MASKVISAMFIVAGIIHMLPLSGAVGVERLSALYGVSLTGLGPELEILMRHRAVLFGLLGLFLMVAAFRPALQVAALIAGAVSVLSFLWLAWSVDGYNDLVRRIVVADWVALVCLAVAAGLMLARPAPA